MKDVIEKYAHGAPKLADWLESDLLDGITVFSISKIHRK